MTSAAHIQLPENWYTRQRVDNVSDDLPGIYEWRIEGVGVYIGKYGRIRRPTKEYARNLTRMLNQKDYRRGNSNGFRAIHRALFEAHNDGTNITLTILENVDDPHKRTARERELICQRRSEAAAGGLKVLNSN